MLVHFGPYWKCSLNLLAFKLPLSSVEIVEPSDSSEKNRVPLGLKCRLMWKFSNWKTRRFECEPNWSSKIAIIHFHIKALIYPQCCSKSRYYRMRVTLKRAETVSLALSSCTSQKHANSWTAKHNQAYAIQAAKSLLNRDYGRIRANNSHKPIRWRFTSVHWPSTKLDENANAKKQVHEFPLKSGVGRAHLSQI